VLNGLSETTELPLCVCVSTATGAGDTGAFNY